MAVRGRAYDRLGAETAASSWSVLYDEWLTKSVRQPLPD